MTARDHRERAKVMCQVADSLRLVSLRLIAESVYFNASGPSADISPSMASRAIVDHVVSLADHEEHLARELEWREKSSA